MTSPTGNSLDNPIRYQVQHRLVAPNHVSQRMLHCPKLIDLEQVKIRTKPAVMISS